jgi:hypothetical protein
MMSAGIGVAWRRSGSGDCTGASPTGRQGRCRIRRLDQRVAGPRERLEVARIQCHQPIRGRLSRRDHVQEIVDSTSANATALALAKRLKGVLSRQVHEPHEGKHVVLDQPAGERGAQPARVAPAGEDRKGLSQGVRRRQVPARGDQAIACDVSRLVRVEGRDDDGRVQVTDQRGRRRRAWLARSSRNAAAASSGAPVGLRT